MNKTLDESSQELWLKKNCKSEFEKYISPSDIAGLKNGDDEYIGEVKEGKANGRGIYNWKIGYQYLGDWVDDKPQGNGVLIYPDNRKYEGDFLNGKQEGKGKLYWTNGDIYEGEFLGGNREGKAEFLFLDGTTFFEGAYMDNFSEGLGIIKSKNGDLYKGNFNKGKRNGQGRYLWSDGRMYYGDFHNGQRTGSAIFIRGMTVKDVKEDGHPLVLEKIPESVRQVGGDWIIYFEYQKNYLDPSKVVAYRDGDNWYNDKAVKVCDIKFPYKNHKLLNDAADGKIGPLGNLYDGEWKDGKYHGIGMFTWISNDGTSYYEGSWRLGKRTGKGIYIFKNGQKYEGDFIDNKRTGKGTLKYSDSDDRKEYVGDWIDGKRDGKGTMTWKTGDEKGANGNKRFLNIYIGEWKKDWQHGKGKMTYENPESPSYDYGPIGGVYDGEWEMGERNGFGIFISEEGWTYQGLWKDGRRHGKGEITYDNGKKEEAIWINDAKGGSLKEQFKEFIIRNKDAFEENSDFLKIEIYFSKEFSLNLKYLQGQPKGDVTYSLHEICDNVKNLLEDYDSIFENYFEKPCKGQKLESILFSDRLDDGDIEFEREYYYQRLKDGTKDKEITNKMIDDGYTGKGTFFYTSPKLVSELESEAFFTWTKDGNYVGEWKDGKEDGKGTFTWADGTKYEGEWKEGKCYGFGIITYDNGNEYEGEWKEGKIHGKGTFIYNNGNQYVGEFKDGKQNGKGTYTYTDGGKYVGEWRDGEENGKGIYTYVDGAKYIGEFNQGMMSGEASLFLPDGVKYYKGKFKNNERNGQGENYWPVANEFHNVPAGTRYIGEWLNDKQHGYGKAIFADGTIKEGKWENGEFIG